MTDNPFFGVDAAAGLKMLGGNTKIYARLLGTYASGDLYDKFVEAVRAANAGGDVEAARMAAHTLKGASGNLHLRDVFEKIRDIEGKIKETGRMPAPDELAELDAIQQSTLQSIALLTANPEQLDQFK